MNVTLQAKIIFVRAGELNIGNATDPFNATALILLYGNQTSETVVYSNNIDTGNKMLANTAAVNIYGLPRTGRTTRLLKTANRGDALITVEKNLDWVAGDEIGLAPTGLAYDESDYASVVAYSPSTGVANLDRPLSSYHWGALTSTGP